MSLLRRCLLPLCLLSLVATPILRAQQTMDNAAVIKLVKSGLGEDLIVQTITASNGHYDTGTNDLIALKTAGVTDKEISAMITKDSGTPASVAASPLPASASPAAPNANGQYMLREGSDVNLQFAESLSSKTATEGDPVTLTLVDDLKVGDVVVATAGTTALGEVTKAEKSGMLGKAGQLNIRLDYLKVGDYKIMLRGTKGKEGESGTTGAIVLTVLFGPIGLIKHGKQVEIPKGQALHAFVGNDIELPPAI